MKSVAELHGIVDVENMSAEARGISDGGVVPIRVESDVIEIAKGDALTFE